MATIPCFDKLKALGKAKQLYNKRINSTMTETELKEVGKKIALDLHKKLHSDLMKFRKMVGAEELPYEAPNPEDAARIHKEYDDRVSQINQAHASELQANEDHRQQVHDNFRQAFESKGVPKEQVEASLALMDARAASWASEQKGRTPADWYKERIAGESVPQPGDHTIQHTIDITPEMRKQALEGQPLFQKGEKGARGAIETLQDGRVVIHAMESPDASTMVHEIWHVFEKDLSDSERKSLEKWSKEKSGTTAYHEAMANAGVRYMREGVAPTPALKSVFEKFKQWLTAIYQKVSGTDIAKRLSPEVRQIFDRLLTDKNQEDASNLRSNQGQGRAGGNAPQSGQNQGSENIQRNAPQEAGSAGTEQQAGSGQPPTEEETGAAGGNERVSISHDSLTEIAKRLGIKEPERGYIPPIEELMNMGHRLIDSGVDPEEIAAQFKKDHSISMAKLSVVSAHAENLIESADEIYNKYGAGSPEYEAAKAEVERWNNDVAKPMGTEWGGSGQVINGIRVDEASPTSMNAAFKDGYKKDPTVEQEKKIADMASQITTLADKVKDLESKLTEAIDKNEKEESPKTFEERAKKVANTFRKLKNKPFTFKDENGNDIEVTKAGLSWNDAVEAGSKLIEETGKILDGVAEVIKNVKDSDWYKKLSDSDKTKLEAQLSDHFKAVEEEEPEDIHTKYVDKEGNKFSPEEAREIWKYAKKTYWDQGANFPEMVAKTATDLGMDQDQVYHAVVSPKNKRIADAMWLERRKESVARRNAKAWLLSAEKTRLGKAVKFLPSAFFNLSTFGHGTVGPITHAGMNIMTPEDWKAYWPNAIKGFQMAYGKTATYERTMTQFVNRENYAFWLRNQLAIDPRERYDDYQYQEQGQGNLFKRLFHRMGVAGDRGFNALKLMRYDLAELWWNRLSDAEKADPTMPKKIAEAANNATGTTTTTTVPGWSSTVFFAPKLEVSRWKRYAEPFKAADTLANWGKATPAEKAMARIYTKRAAQMLGMYWASLGANAGLLWLAGSKQKMNVTDPTRSDYMKFKVGGKTLDISGGMLSAFDFVAKLLHDSFAKKGGDSEIRDRADAIGSDAFSYARGKLSPFASLPVDFFVGSDVSRRPYFWSKDKPPKGKTKYTWQEYALEHGPIPLSEGVRDLYDQMRESGMNHFTTMQYLNGIVVAVTSGFTGTRVSQDKPKKGKPAARPKAPGGI